LVSDKKIKTKLQIRNVASKQDFDCGQEATTTILNPPIRECSLISAAHQQFGYYLWPLHTMKILISLATLA
jgi:hypothetical protein